MCVAKIEATKGATERAAQRESFTTGSKEATINRSDYDLDLSVSKVTQVQLDTFCARFSIPPAITMRVLARGELPSNTQEDENEISFPVIAFECGVKPPLAFFMRQFLSELPLLNSLG